MGKRKGPLHSLKRYLQIRLLGSRKYRRMEEFQKRFPDCGIHWTCDIAKTGTVNIGYGTYMGENGRILCWHPDDVVEIGRFCSIAGHVIILNGRDHGLSRATTFPVKYFSPGGLIGPYEEKGMRTVIGNDVWIGTRATILGGVTIGHGAAVGAGAVVTSNVEPYTVVAGVPAKPTRRRTTDANVEKLVKIAWWDWPLERIKDRITDLDGLLEDFVRKYYPPTVNRQD